MSCRFPGQASSVKGLWEMCCNGENAWSEFLKDRMNGENYWYPNISKHGSFNAKGAHFLKEDVALFDALFFNISPTEASVTYKALENAGTPLNQIVGQEVGVFVGGSMSDYQNLLHKDIGNANRISYIYDLKGPSVSVDTAYSIRNGEIRQALVGGVYILLSPENMIAMSMLGLFGTDGLSYSYDHRVTGYGRGEGGGIIVLKPLEDAIANGDTIYAVIRHTGTNQDVYSQAGLDPLDTHYVEVYGTGTAVGDPIEASAIARSLARNRPHDEPLYIGSVKSNIGHLEAGSGLAGVIKASLVLENGLIPPNVNFEKANEEIPFESWKLKVPTEATPWPSPGIRRASISSFGFGGTNVHIILESASRVKGLPQAATTLNVDGHKRFPTSPLLFKFSAAHKEGVQLQMSALADYLTAQSPTIADGNKTLLADLAYTLSERRTLLEWRATVTASTVEELVESMVSCQTEPIAALEKPRIAFVFTGQGSQWPGMSRDLMRYPAFAMIIERCEECLQSMGATWSLLPTTAIQIALVSLLATWNVNPVAVLGHSSGEIAAAFAAGALSLSSCMAVAYHRGELASKLAGRGAMVAIGATVAEVTSLLQKVVGGEAVIACINSPSLITVSGDIAAVDSLQTLATDANYFARKLKVDTAYHSHHMKEIEAEYLSKLGGIEPSPTSESSPRFHSSLRGKQVPLEDLRGIYWSQNLINPVLFSQALTDMCLERSNNTPILQMDVILEIRPHLSLKAPIQDTLRSRAYGALHCLGYPVDCSDFSSSSMDAPRNVLSDLPQYP
ncbi:thiolase-like protein [Usnea florida]